MNKHNVLAAIGGIVAASLVLGTAAGAQTPKRGGILTTLVEIDPTTTDCHAASIGQVLQYISPHYSTLMRFDSDHWPNIVGDLADSWKAATDGLTYTVKLRPNIHFHDGSTLTSEDVKASFERLRNPPTGVISVRQTSFDRIATIDTPDRDTIVFRLSQPDAAFLTILASPFNCIYSAKKLAENPKYPSTEVMGSGPFAFVEYVKGSHWIGKRFDQYFLPNRPYLDGFKVVQVTGAAAVNAVAGGQVDANFRFVSPPELDHIKTARGDRVTSQSAVLNALTLATFNLERKPFDDIRVRRALNVAIDRVAGDAILSKLTVLKGTGGVMRPSSEFALEAADRAKLPGFGDIKAAREEAKKLLAEAGVSDLKLKLMNRTIQTPYQSLGIFLIDQWRQIGVTGEMVLTETAPYFANLKGGNFDIAIDFNSTVTDDPSEVLAKYLPGSPINYSRDTDAILIDLYNKQRSADPTQRRSLVHDFENRIFAQLPVIPLFWNQRTVVMGSDVKGWQVTPSLFVGNDLADVWLDR